MNQTVQIRKTFSESKKVFWHSLCTDFKQLFYVFKGLYEMGRKNLLEIELGLSKDLKNEWQIRPTAQTLRKIPKSHQTKEMVSYIISHDGLALQYVSKRLLSYDLCKIAVEQNGCALEYVPDKFKSKDLCLVAVENNGKALCAVPMDLINRELVIMAICQTNERDMWRRYPVYYVPKKLLSEDVVILSVEYSPHSIKDIPKRFYTKELIQSALSRDGTVLQYIPKKYLTDELIESVVFNEPTSIKYVPKNFLTSKLCMEAFKRNHNLIRWIPSEFVSYDMCLEIIDTLFVSCDESDMFSTIPKSIRNNDNYLDAVIEKKGASSLLEWNKNIIQYKTVQQFSQITKLDISLKAGH